MGEVVFNQQLLLGRRGMMVVISTSDQGIRACSGI
jgi:hypothetical protein